MTSIPVLRVLVYDESFNKKGWWNIFQLEYLYMSLHYQSTESPVLKQADCWYPRKQCWFSDIICGVWVNSHPSHLLWQIFSSFFRVLVLGNVSAVPSEVSWIPFTRGMICPSPKQSQRTESSLPFRLTRFFHAFDRYTVHSLPVKGMEKYFYFECKGGFSSRHRVK